MDTVGGITITGFKNSGLRAYDPESIVIGKTEVS